MVKVPSLGPVVLSLLLALLAHNTQPVSSQSSPSSSSSFLAAAPGPDVVDGFWRSPTVRRDLVGLCKLNPVDP
jgi:hypothetical protein